MANADIGMVSDMFDETNMSDNKRGSLHKKTAGKRYFWTSALARRMISFNLIALCVLLLGMLYLSQFQNGAASERLTTLRSESTLYAQLLQERLASNTNTETTLEKISANLPSAGLSVVRVFDANNKLLNILPASYFYGAEASKSENRSRLNMFLDTVTRKIAHLFKGKQKQSDTVNQKNADQIAQKLAKTIQSGGAKSLLGTTSTGEVVVAAGQPITVNNVVVGAVVSSTPQGMMEMLRKQERNAILRLFGLAAGLSIILSLVLANTIANPIYDLAAAMDAGTTSKLRKDNPERVMIPDMTGRDDEIGHLSSAMRNMTSALYHRIEANEQFAADVAHEIKNPLASLRSAIETLRIAPEGEKRNSLLDVVEHDVRRLDRLVSDISNASRLDSELVKEEEEHFNLTVMLQRIVEFYSLEAKDQGVEMIFDESGEDIFIDGLEERLAQVFVNLLTNAVSFCEKGDAVRLWARRVENRVLIVVEDTGVGIPEDSLAKVFKRFYSNRPVKNFGNNSGLGLSISRQIIEAHGGVIWAENIYVKDAPEGSPPLGARFVVGLPG